MPTPLELAGIGAMGNVNWVVVPAIAGSVPTTSEITATGSLDITGFLYATAATPSHTANKVTAPRRMADTRQFQRFGLTVDDIGQLMYMVDPQAAANAAAKKAMAVCAEFSSKFLVVRMGPSAPTDFAVGQFVRWTPVQFGPQLELADTSAEENEIHIVQDVNITTPGWSQLLAIAT